MIKGFKIRIYPNKDQEQKFWRHIGASRWIYNYMLAEQIRRYENGEKHMSAFDMNKALTPLKRQVEYAWLNEVGSNTLYRVCADVANAYKAFFAKRAKRPRFKSRKKSKPSFPLRDSVGYVWFGSDVVHLPSIGGVRYKTDYNLPLGRDAKLSNPRISYRGNKWFLSFGLECESQAPELNDYSMGIDLGIKETMVVAYGGQQLIFHNINKGRKMRNLQKRMRHLQRTISRKYEVNRVGRQYIKTNNILRAEERLRKLYAKQTGIRMNYIHQSTHALVDLLPHRVVMENLDVRGMLKNKFLSAEIHKQCFREIIRQMQYKCEWNGIEFVQADRFYPSSKTCSNCGCVHKGLKLRDRTFVCPECGFTIDRDYQAALNLSRYAT